MAFNSTAAVHELLQKPWFIGFILVLTLAFARRLAARNQRRRLPGPKGLPFIGSAFKLPKEREWLVYQNWASQYGSDVLYFESWGRPHIVINSHDAAVELLEKRSAVYSDRPRMPMVNELVGFEWDFAFMPYADEWKDTRRAFTQHFKQGAVAQYRPIEVKRTRELLLQLMHTPDDFAALVRLMAGQIIMGIAYGIDVKSLDDPYVEIARKALYAMNVTGNVGTYLVDHIPALKYVPEWFPGAGFKRQAREWRVFAEAMVTAPAEAVKAAMANGTAVPSMLSSLFDRMGEKGDRYRERVAANAAAAAYEGGSETTFSALLSLVLIMLLNPDVQRKAQEEIDRVVGSDRLPEFSDQPSLPYITAMCKEVLRWRPVLPLAVMRRVSADDEYKGCHVPKGTTVIVNSWAILHDPTTYPNPDKFIPERFLTADGQLNPDAPEPTASFGYGRRGCPGMYMGFDSLWITAASLVWAFDVERYVDQEGRVHEPTGEFTFGLVCYPAPFRCAFKPRSEKVAELVRAVNEHL